MLKTIRLHGALGKKYGRTHKIAVQTPREAIRALTQRCGIEFRKDIAAGHFNVIRGKNRDKNYISEAEVGLPFSDNEIHFIPTVAGSNGGVMTIVGIALIVVGTFVPGAQFLIGPGVAMVAGGIAQMLAPHPKMDKGSSVDSNPSYIFNGPQNTLTQGGPVPLVYGKVRCGSVVISSAIDVEQIGTDGHFVSINPLSVLGK